MKKNRRSLNRKKRVNKIKSGSRSSNAGKATKVLALPEYYQLVFSEIHDIYRDEIYQKYVLDSQSFRRDAICKYKYLIIGKDHYQQYEVLQNILCVLEEEMGRVIKRHSVFFWLHLYRRIAPCLAEDLGANTSESVTVNVRQQAEQAIKKYGKLSCNNDFSLSSNADFGLILGGLLKKSYTKNFERKIVSFYEKELKRSPQWVLTDFKVDDVLDVYYIEGISYQYWYVSAKMRSLGKGIALSISDLGDVTEERTIEQESLILDFDRRNEEDNIQLGIASNVGTYTASNLKDVSRAHEIILIPYINASHYTAKILGLTDLPDEFSPNYIPWFINSNDFYNSHSYLSKKFMKKFGFGLLELLQFAGFLSNYIMSNDPRRKAINKSIGLSYHSKFNRVLHSKSFFRRDKDEILKYYDSLKNNYYIKESELEYQIDSIFDHVILSEEKQRDIGIWSRGPQYVLIALDEGYLCDSSSWHFLFQNMFYGLRHYDPKSIKGHEFEATLSDVLEENDFDVIKKSFVIVSGESKREIDVAVRIQDNLYLFECKASERPLNFDIGNPKTIEKRTKDLKEKLGQADSLKDFVLENKVGNNYDFSWAKNVNSCVVSPFTEWIWSADNYLWTDCKKFPRVISVHGTIQYLISEKSRLSLEATCS
ncbi:hypothetical protein [Pseudoalteromonas sp. Scap06]|uniref:hypothetical protein n=1 Tax=Pseudoalteromonas sp. Scap06 TaxID=2589991 RepID=UPI0015C0F1C4|nr:hypothetical protein [Pseudoalteromonas sp. Scap06]QLE91395.1 hypothetical protein FLM47_18195 [Pseudoalteromonas sp. Scap06]